MLGNLLVSQLDVGVVSLTGGELRGHCAWQHCCLCLQTLARDWLAACWQPTVPLHKSSAAAFMEAGDDHRAVSTYFIATLRN